MLKWILLLNFLVFATATYSGNYALSFDGQDDIVVVPHTFQDDSMNDFWTIEAWINPTSEQNFWQLNIAGYPQRHPNVNYCGPNNSQCRQGAPIVQLRDAAGEWLTAVGDATLITPDAWHHLAGTWDNNTLTIYLDGVKDISIQPYTKGYTEALSCTKSNMYSCDAGLQIGGNRFRMGDNKFDSQYFRGLIDDVRVWTFAKTQQEIQASMNKALSGQETGLLYYFRFDDIGTQVTKSYADHIYALLGDGRLSAQPKFVVSTAPLSAPPTPPEPVWPTQAPIRIENKESGAVVAGALIGIFCLLGGAAVGLFIGFKHGHRFLPSAWGGSSEERTPLAR